MPQKHDQNSANPQDGQDSCACYVCDWAPRRSASSYTTYIQRTLYISWLVDMYETLIARLQLLGLPRKSLRTESWAVQNRPTLHPMRRRACLLVVNSTTDPTTCYCQRTCNTHLHATQQQRCAREVGLILDNVITVLFCPVNDPHNHIIRFGFHGTLDPYLAC